MPFQRLESRLRATFFVGAAWEYEFDGEANTQVYGLDIAAPTLKGDSGIFESGFRFKPAKSDNVSFNPGLQAYTGVMEGWPGRRSSSTGSDHE